MPLFICSSNNNNPHIVTNECSHQNTGGKKNGCLGQCNDVVAYQQSSRSTARSFCKERRNQDHNCIAGKSENCHNRLTNSSQDIHNTGQLQNLNQSVSQDHSRYNLLYSGVKAFLTASQESLDDGLLLTTGTHDPRLSAVMDVLIEHGAPEDVRYSHKPHVGTDVLRQVVKSIRLELQTLGCDIRFEHRLDAIQTRDGRVCGLTVEGPEGPYTLPCHTLVLAPGHSARDTFTMLHDLGVPMEQKAFAIGVRIEHAQAALSEAQYGPAWQALPPSDYKLACHLPSGRSVFSFCVCPGGQVVAAASAPGQVVTNGMSYRDRAGVNINGGLLVGVGPEDFPGTDPLAGVRFQETWEHAAWTLGASGGSTPFSAPAQLVGDLLASRSSNGAGAISPTYRPGVTWTALDPCLPPYVIDSLRAAIPLLDRKVHGFACPDAVLTGVETRSSSPVRILRDGNGMSSLTGLYPCGEGAGYAGGIMSAAADGIRIAEHVACI